MKILKESAESKKIKYDYIYSAKKAISLNEQLGTDGPEYYIAIWDSLVDKGWVDSDEGTLLLNYKRSPAYFTESSARLAYKKLKLLTMKSVPSDKNSLIMAKAIS